MVLVTKSAYINSISTRDKCKYGNLNEGMINLGRIASSSVDSFQTLLQMLLLFVSELHSYGGTSARHQQTTHFLETFSKAPPPIDCKRLKQY